MRRVSSRGMQGRKKKTESGDCIKKRGVLATKEEGEAIPERSGVFPKGGQPKAKGQGHVRDWLGAPEKALQSCRVRERITLGGILCGEPIRKPNPIHKPREGTTVTGKPRRYSLRRSRKAKGRTFRQKSDPEGGPGGWNQGATL